MKRAWPGSPRLVFWLAVGICVSVALLAWFGFRASREFQDTSRLVVQRRADEAARLLVTALTRDMRGAQTTILSSSTWDDFGDTSHERNALVASAFARYPYPEAFLAWEAREGEVVFYARSDRPPAWAPPAAEPILYPVRMLLEPAIGRELLARMEADAARGSALSVAELELGGSMYQVVTVLRYGDHLRLRLASARGFMVNLPWVSDHYFAELMGQVAQIGSENAGLAYAIVDDRGAAVAGSANVGDRTFIGRRTFPLAFFDPVLAPDTQSFTEPPRSWAVLAGAAWQPAIGVALYGADITLALAALAAVVLALGLGVTARGIRKSAELAEMRTEFMSSVTHELKTPIASIQAMGETLSLGRLRDQAAQQEYATVVVQEAKRLGRLVNNVLAFSRLTDVADVYAFERLDLDDLIGASLTRFKRPLQQQQCQVTMDVPADVPSILADRAAMELLFDNLLDNAIRHSGTKEIRIAAEPHGRSVSIEISDRGAGIAAEDLDRVTQKFMRGRNAAAGGSGLGLAIVDRIVRDHQGRLTITSTPGGGTTVRIVLPAASEERLGRRRPSVGDAHA